MKYVIMFKHLTFLHYIPSESTESMISKVYIALNSESRREDFHEQVEKDKMALSITFTKEKKIDHTYTQWNNIIHKSKLGKKIVKSKIDVLALTKLVLENSTKEKKNN